MNDTLEENFSHILSIMKEELQHRKNINEIISCCQILCHYPLKAINIKDIDAYLEKYPNSIYKDCLLEIRGYTP